jgi:hypothetical protein
MLQLVYAAIPKAALAAGCVVLTVLLAGQTVVAHRASARSAQDRAKLAEATQAWTEASAASLARERAREQAWAADQKEITDAYAHVAAQLAAARADADAVSVRVHRAARAAVSACRGRQDPGTAGDGSAAGGSDFLLAELFERADRRAGELAAFADLSRAAGLECQQRYESLIKQ